jgi:hypothetical protein
MSYFQICIILAVEYLRLYKCVGVSRHVGVGPGDTCHCIRTTIGAVAGQKSTMKKVCLLLLAVFNLSQAVLYRRTVSYEGELVAQW